MSSIIPQQTGLVKGNLAKHEATVFIRSNLSSLQRKAWNVLTNNALNEGIDQENHSVPLEALRYAIGYTSRDTQKFRASLKELTRATIEWIRQDPNGDIEVDEEWGACSFLAQVTVSSGEVRYCYAPFLKEQLKRTKVYAQINMMAQRELPKGRSQSHYEICVRYRPNLEKKFPGLTPKLVY